MKKYYLTLENPERFNNLTKHARRNNNSIQNLNLQNTSLKTKKHIQRKSLENNVPSRSNFSLPTVNFQIPSYNIVHTAKLKKK